MNGVRRFAHGFRQCRVRVAGPREVFRRAAEFHQHSCLVDEFARARADDMDAEHDVGCSVRQDLHEAIGGAVGARAAVAVKLNLPAL